MNLLTETFPIAEVMRQRLPVCQAIIDRLRRAAAVVPIAMHAVSEAA